MPRFEIGIYNQKVRELVTEGNSHKHLDDDWSDVHYFEVKAPSVEAAKSKLATQYPPEKGYVFDYALELEDED